jgi:hypothetical protein
VRLRDHDPLPEIEPVEEWDPGFWVGVLWGLVPGLALGFVAAAFVFCRAAERMGP